jgi:hypothetical protein
MNLFGKKAGHDPLVVQQLSDWTRESLNLTDEATIRVMELRCAEDDCPEVETVIAILEPGRQRKFKVLKPLAEVRREDLTQALSQPNG